MIKTKIRKNSILKAVNQLESEINIKSKIKSNPNLNKKKIFSTVLMKKLTDFLMI